MAISAINSININNVAFKGVQTAAKAADKKEDNGFLEDKELVVGLSLVGLAVLGAAVLVRKGKADKAAEAVTSITDRNYQGIIGNSGIQKMKNAVEVAKTKEMVARGEASLTSWKHNPVYADPKVGEEVFAQAPLDGKDPIVRGWIRANEAKAQGKEIDPEDFIAYAKVEGLNLADLVK